VGVDPDAPVAVDFVVEVVAQVVDFEPVAWGATVVNFDYIDFVDVDY